LSTNEWTFLSPVRLSQSASLLGRCRPGFSLKELFLVTDLTHSFHHSSQLPLPVAFPSTLIAAARAVTELSPGFKYYSTVRLLTALHFLFRLTTYKVVYPSATREHHESSWGHTQIFRTVPSAHTLVRRVDVNAFASIPVIVKVTVASMD
jgi:hypothetical protein